MVGQYDEGEPPREKASPAALTGRPSSGLPGREAVRVKMSAAAAPRVIARARAWQRENILSCLMCVVVKEDRSI